MQWRLRYVEKGDEAGVVETVRQVYEEYAFTWEADGYHADLYDLSDYYVPGEIGHFWVCEVEGEVVASGGVRWNTPWWLASPELKLGDLVKTNYNWQMALCESEVTRMYVRPSFRGVGMAGGIMKEILLVTRKLGHQGIEIWSDVQFKDAHRLYERFGAKKIAQRYCDDPDNALEHGLLLKL